jgi:hypothetical protein
MSLYDDLEVKPCNILGFLHFEVCSGNVTLGAFMYEKDALLFKQAAQQSAHAESGWTCEKCGTESNVGYRCSWCESTRPGRQRKPLGT